MSDVRQSAEYVRWMESLGWQVARLGNNVIYVKKLSFVGSVVKLLRPVEPIDFAQIEKVARENRALFVKIEPDISADLRRLEIDLAKNGYKEEKWALLPTVSLRVDIAKQEKEIFLGFSKDRRYEIRKAKANNLKVEKNNFDKFYDLLLVANKKKGLWTFPKKQFEKLVLSFGKNIFCLGMYGDNDDKYVAGNLVLVNGKTAYYFLAGSLPEGKEKHAPSLAVWQAMLEAKRRHCAVWDFEGLIDRRIPSTKHWEGFSRFKKGFAGEEVAFPGSFTKYFNPILKQLSRFF